jgi:hypothetical protein
MFAIERGPSISLIDRSRGPVQREGPIRMNRFDQRSQQRLFFEELCRLRALYRLRSAYDASPVMSVDAATAYASELLTQSEASPARVASVDVPSGQAGQ